jgi:hypothetical protein
LIVAQKNEAEAAFTDDRLDSVAAAWRVGMAEAGEPRSRSGSSTLW